MDFQQLLQLEDGIAKLGKKLVQGSLKVFYLCLMPVIDGNTAADVNWMLRSHEHGRHLCGCHSCVGGDEADAGHQL